MPPIPPEALPPADSDASEYQDQDVLKVAEKDHARELNAYKQAVKDRDKAISDRQKILAKREESNERT